MEAKILRFPAFDKLVDLVTGLGGARDRTTTQSFGYMTVISDAEIGSMYRSDWIAKKLIDIVAEDMIRGGRKWKATKDQITSIETTENLPQIALWSRMDEVLKRARLWGGAAVYLGVRGQSPASELDLESVKKGDLEYITVLSRHQLSYSEVDRDPLSRWYGEPKMWEIRSAGGEVSIHPSRIVRFTGPMPLTEEISVGARESLLSSADVLSDGVWGDSVLQGVYEAVKNAASAQQHIAGLIPDARTDVIYIPALGKILQNAEQTKQLTERFAYARQMKSMFSLLLLEGNGVTGVGQRGEEWKQRQVSFTQLPETLTAFLEIVSAAADIPITRFLGQTPGGLKSTGESDLRNYYDHVGALQKMQLGPGISRIDEVVIRSALGTRPPEIFYEWSPLFALTEGEKADVLTKTVKAARDAVGKSGDTPIVNPLAMSVALTNAIVEQGVLPGLETAAEENPLTQKEIDAAKPPAPANANNAPTPQPAKATGTKDKAPTALYVRRQVLNTRPILAWARAQGIVGLVAAEDLHVTVLSSEEPVDWLKMGSDGWGDPDGTITVSAGGPRIVEKLGPKATVLEFASSSLSYRHSTLLERGASSDFEGYIPHITLSIEPQTVDLATVKPYIGPIELGPEIFEERKLP